MYTYWYNRFNLILAINPELPRDSTVTIYLFISVLNQWHLVATLCYCTPSVCMPQCQLKSKSHYGFCWLQFNWFGQVTLSAISDCRLEFVRKIHRREISPSREHGFYDRSGCAKGERSIQIKSTQGTVTCSSLPSSTLSLQCTYSCSQTTVTWFYANKRVFTPSISTCFSVLCDAPAGLCIYIHVVHVMAHLRFIT